MKVVGILGRKKEEETVAEDPEVPLIKVDPTGQQASTADEQLSQYSKATKAFVHWSKPPSTKAHVHWPRASSLLHN